MEFEWNGVIAKIETDGKVIITQTSSDGGEDIIDTQASFIHRLSKIMYLSRRTVWKDEPPKYKSEEEYDDSGI